jgi:hypothetical protein
MRNFKKQTKTALISARIDSNLFESVKKYSEAGDISISFLVDNALSFFMYCLENEEGDSDIKQVLDEYYETSEDTQDTEDEEEGNESNEE